MLTFIGIVGLLIAGGLFAYIGWNTRNRKDKTIAETSLLFTLQETKEKDDKAIQEYMERMRETKPYNFRRTG